MEFIHLFEIYFHSKGQKEVHIFMVRRLVTSSGGTSDSLIGEVSLNSFWVKRGERSERM
jgi:hypothetical protein